MFCTKCGNKVADGAKFCDKCGNMLEPSAPVRHQPNVGVKKPSSKAPIVIGVCAAVAVITISAVAVIGKLAFGTKEADATDKQTVAVKKESSVGGAESETITITKDLEEQYQERLTAYEEYFAQVKSDNADLQIGGTITLDSEGLPLLWVCLGDSEKTSDVRATQLVGVEDKKAKVLAESGELLLPLRGGRLVMAATWNKDRFYVYDERQGFVQVASANGEYRLYDEDTQEYVDLTGEKIKPVYSDDELEKKAEYLTEVYRGMYSLKIGIGETAAFKVAADEEAQKIYYLGTIDPTFYRFMALEELSVIMDDSYRDDLRDARYCLRNDYADNQMAKDFFSQLPEKGPNEAAVKTAEKAGLLTQVSVKGIECSPVPKIEPFGMLFADGTKVSRQEAELWMEIFSDKDDGLREVGEYCNDFKLERIIRELQRKPRYSQGELYACLASVACGYELVDFEREDYALSGADNAIISDLERGYLEGFFRGKSIAGFTDETMKVFFTDGMIEKQKSLANTEPYRTILAEGITEIWGRDEAGLWTVVCMDGNSYMFQFEFDESAEKISDIRYDSVSASESEPDWFINEEPKTPQVAEPATQ